MTKPQIWIATFLTLFILLFVLSRLTKQEDTESPKQNTSTVPQSNMSSGDLTPKELVTKLGCITCHGADLQGTKMGPSLHGVSEYLGRDKLISYMRNPSSFSDTERFQKLQEKFPGMIMPSFGHVDVKDLGKIADYLLKLKPEEEKKTN